MQQLQLDNYSFTDLELSFSGVSCDSRDVQPGDAFVAINGFKEDGHKYIKEAILKGASIVFTENQLNKENYPVPVIQVKDSRAFLGKLAAQFYLHPSHKLNVIGVTGTNGKTTTTYLIYHLLNYKTKNCGLIGTVTVDTGGKIEDGNLTTPQAVHLQKYLNQMAEQNLLYGCMEVSSHGIQLKRIEGTRFAAKVGTNITADHFDLHANFADYIAVKKSFLTEDNPETLVLLNIDDPYLSSFGKIACHQVYFGIDKTAQVVAKDISYDGVKTRFNYHLNQQLKNGEKIINPTIIPIEMSLLGKHNIYNALVAITLGLYYGLQPELIQNFFSEFPGVWRRLQIIYDQAFTVIDDCAHNPGSYQAVFEAIKNLTYHKLYLINSLRGNRGIKINQANAETISKWLKKSKNYQLFTVNCTDVVKPIDKVKQKEEREFLKVLDQEKINYIHFQKLEKALNTVSKIANKDDLVLLLGPHAMDHAGEMMMTFLQPSNSIK